eukprot:TRINITY_DN61650_c0_g1_i1.p1 TRINITY_DN61650_c0_g1~~TRINITY_DN61650_c0_g1_i1.p1  ORF type:complete len:457 (+),score=64.16 TRINITY_DN61650_c0_g1_i1:1-1371(+)
MASSLFARRSRFLRPCTLVLAFAAVLYWGVHTRAFAGVHHFLRSGRLWRVAMAATILDRSSAKRKLGIDERKEFTAEELKRAYRQAVRKSHPDTPGGSAERLQEVKDAYDFLTSGSSYSGGNGGYRSYGRTNQKAWQDIPQTGNDGPVGSDSGFDADIPRWAYENSGSATPEEYASKSRRESLALGTVALGVLIVATSVTVQRREDAEQMSTDNFATVPIARPLSAKPTSLVGLEYIAEIGEAKRKKSPVLLLGDVLPGGSDKQGLATLERGRVLTQSLLAVLETADPNEQPLLGEPFVPKFRSVTAVVAQPDLLTVVNELRQDTDQWFEPRWPYLEFGASRIARFERSGPPVQEIIIVGAASLSRPNLNWDALAARSIARVHPPDLVILDLTQQQLKEIKSEYAAAQGGEARPFRELLPQELPLMQPVLQEAAARAASDASLQGENSANAASSDD